LAARPSTLGRRASHEFILTFAKQAKDNHATALDIAKRLLYYGRPAHKNLAPEPSVTSRQS